MTQQDLNGKTALVTGAAKGIGRACCLRLAAAGANIAINYMTSEAAAQETLASTGSFKGLLPGGEYTVGEHPFTVEPGGKNALRW